MSDSRWYFTEEQLANSPSRKCGINAELELSYRQRAANLIQEMGQRLQVSQLCINTAIVYMHRFYAFHSFTMFHRNTIASAAFFLAAKVEEQPRKLEHVIKILNICLEKTEMNRESYADQAQELVLNENILLQTLGFDVAIDHPHTHVVKACQLFNIVTVSRELRQTCYFMASNSLHLTTMCLKYRPTVVAAFCIYIACKWSRWEIPDSSEGKAWYSYVDETVTLDTLKKLTEEYLQILERSPSKFKSKMKAITSNGQAGVNQSPGISDGPSTSHHNKNHEKHHHHHHKNASMSSATNSSMNANANGNSRTSSKAQVHQMSTSNSSSQYKQAPPSQSGLNVAPVVSSNHNVHRQRPPPNQQQPYPSSSQSKPTLIDDRHQRLMHQDGQYYNSSSNQRISDHPKHRLSSNSAQPLQPPLPPQPQPPLPQPYMKLGMNEQKNQHNLMSNNTKQQPPLPIQGIDLHQKNVKQQNSSLDYHSSSSSSSRNNSMNPQLNPQIPNNSQKKSHWSQQQQQQQSSISQQQQMQPHNQDKQYTHLQKNIQMSNATNIIDQCASNMLNSSSKSNLQQNISLYNEISTTKQQQQQHQHSTTVSQNDFWFNEKLNEMSRKPSTPPRQTKSLFSPSPEHDSGTNEKAKYMMMTGSLKRESAVDSPKEEHLKKTSTPTKREKSMLANQSTQKLNNPPLPPQTTNQLDKKFSSKLDMNMPANLPPLPPSDPMDPQLMKKRSYSSVSKDIESSNNRETKIRRVEQIKSEPNIPTNLPTPSSQSIGKSHISALSLSMTPVPSKQPIETNPDIVKSLLQECFSSSKFDAYDIDSPLDVINPEPPEELLATTHVVSNINNSNSNSMNVNQQSLQMMSKHESLDDLLDIKDDKLDSSAGESSRKDHKKKSKKKKEKHKHKKKHKSSDREDNKSDSSSIKIIFSKDGNKNDSKSSPESFSGGLKIKIPINKDAAAAAVAAGKNDANPAPLKLKISKEKFGKFTNVNSNNSNNNNNNNSTSTSSHHHKNKKDKEREKSKSKSSKHYNSSDFDEAAFDLDR